MFKKPNWSGLSEVQIYIQSLNNSAGTFNQSKSRFGRQRARSLLVRYAEQKGFCIVCKKFCFIPEHNSKLKNDARAHNRATFDHVIPASQTRANGLKNCVMMCSQCNNERGNIPYWMYRTLKWFRIPSYVIKDIRKTYSNNGDMSYTDRFHKKLSRKNK